MKSVILIILSVLLLNIFLINCERIQEDPGPGLSNFFYINNDTNDELYFEIEVFDEYYAQYPLDIPKSIILPNERILSDSNGFPLPYWDICIYESIEKIELIASHRTFALDDEAWNIFDNDEYIDHWEFRLSYIIGHF